MEPSLNTQCEELRRANAHIEEENKKLVDLISSREKEPQINDGLPRLSEIKLQDEPEGNGVGYGENPLSLQKWDSSRPPKVYPVPLQPERYLKAGGFRQGEVRDAKFFGSEEPQAAAQARRPAWQPTFERIGRTGPLTGSSANTARVASSKQHRQSLAEVTEERDTYKARTIKLEKYMENICDQMAQLYQKYEIKVEVSQRLEEDNRALSAKVQQLSQRATLATDEDIEALKATCRLYEEDFQTEKSQREGADTENKKLRAELTESKKEIADLHEKVMMLLSLLGEQQTPSSPRLPVYLPWDIPRRPPTYPYQRWNSGPSTSQPGDVIRRGGNPYGDDDDVFTVRDASYMDCRCRERRKTMSL